MPSRAPTLRRHATGVYCTHWAGRDHYFTLDRAESERLFFAPDSDHPGALRRWQEWSARRFHPRGVRAQAPERVTVAELAKRFLATLYNDDRLRAERYYRLHLRRFLLVFGRFYSDELDEVGLAAFREDLSGLSPRLAPKTIAHDITAVKRVLRWGSAATVRLCPRLDLDTLKPPRLRRSAPEDLPLAVIKDAIAKAGKHTPELSAMLSLNYLCALRPSEVVRLVHGQGRLLTIPPEPGHEAIPRGALELHEHKTGDVTGEVRLIPLSAEALIHYTSLKPLPKRARRGAVPFNLQAEHNRYASACRAAGVPGLAHKLRDSAATHLLALGPGLEASVSLILGHRPSGELPRYGRPSLRVLRDLVSRLTLR